MHRTGCDVFFGSRSTVTWSCKPSVISLFSSHIVMHAQFHFTVQQSHSLASAGSFHCSAVTKSCKHGENSLFSSDTVLQVQRLSFHCVLKRSHGLASAASFHCSFKRHVPTPRYDTRSYTHTPPPPHTHKHTHTHTNIPRYDSRSQTNGLRHYTLAHTRTHTRTHAIARAHIHARTHAHTPNNTHLQQLLLLSLQRPGVLR